MVLSSNKTTPQGNHAGALSLAAQQSSIPCHIGT